MTKITSAARTRFWRAFSVAQVVMPQYAKESKQYTQFRDALSQSPQTRVEILSAGSEWSADFGKTHLRVTAAERTDYGVDEENDFLWRHT
ncbi:MAG: hypothetical protein ACLUHE_14225 [Christensenellales bacterium]